MKKLQRKFIFMFLIAFLGMAFFAVPRAEAAVTVTVTNNRPHTISLAFCWAGFDMPDDLSKGWYNLKAGESRKITFTEALAPMTMEDFGYYAKGTPKGGKTLYWCGRESDERPARYWIHPSKNFTGGHWGEDPFPSIEIEGGQKVFFRNLKLKRTSDADAAASLTFNE